MLWTTTHRVHIPLGYSPFFYLLRSSARCVSSGSGSRPDTTASSQLWSDATKEAADSETRKPDKHTVQSTEYPNWTGEESVQDAVLRMLVDKYKPLRGVSITTAEEKLKTAPPSVRPPEIPALPPSFKSPSLAPLNATSQVTAESETHKPWLTTFRAPSHATSIRYMRLPPLTPSPNTTESLPIHPDDSRSRIEEREKKKKAAYIGRITNALESSLDYRIGKASPVAGNPRMHRPNPISVKGWTSLVEERIERARIEGHFRSIKGRGKPLARESDQSNPFIPREEFLMNRIVQRQGAAPPWVQIQGELETAVASFRSVLQSTWTRRAVRSLMLEHSHELLPRLTLLDVTGSRVRDREWEAREAMYHEEALNEINALVRKYNGVAPYTVRRTYMTQEAELDRMYKASGEQVLAEIRRRLTVGLEGLVEEDGSAVQHGMYGGDLRRIGFSLRAMWNRWLAKFVGG